MKRLLPFAALLALSVGCGPLFFVEAELPSVCKTFPDQAFEAAPPGFHGELAFPTMPLDIGAQLPADLLNDRLNAHLNVLSAQLTAKTGVNELGFIEVAHMDLVPPEGSDLTPVTVLNYTRPTDANQPTTIELADPSHPNVFPFLTAGALNGSLTVSGSLPDVPWTADMHLCVGIEAKLQYL